MGIIYKDIFDFCVLDELDEGKSVYALDKKFGKVSVLNQMTVEELMKILATSRKEETRYTFWIVEEAEDEEDA